MQVHLVPPRIDIPRSAEVRSVSSVAGGDAVVSLSGIDDAATADALAGCHCLVARDDVEGCLGEGPVQGVLFDLGGWTFEDGRSGRTGRVLEVREMPGQTLLVVALDGEGGREHLVPLVDEFVVRADEEGRHFVLDLPQGLFEL